jgi:hypothetical protein
MLITKMISGNNTQFAFNQLNALDEVELPQVYGEITTLLSGDPLPGKTINPFLLKTMQLSIQRRILSRNVTSGENIEISNSVTDDSIVGFEQFALKDLNWCTFIEKNENTRCYHNISLRVIVKYSEGKITIFSAPDLKSFWVQVSFMIIDPNT